MFLVMKWLNPLKWLHAPKEFPLNTSSSIHAVLLTLGNNLQGKYLLDKVSVATSTKYNVSISDCLGSYTVPQLLI